MAVRSSADAATALKKSLHWIRDEVDRLGVCWCAVSTKKGGMGAGQKLDDMWKKIIEKYHIDLPPPPIPIEGRGNESLPQNEALPSSKWKRTRPLIAKYMKCHMIAISNPQSGENAEGVLAMAMMAYKQTESGNFLHLTTYELTKNEPKW